MMPLLQEVKLSLGIKHDKLDDDIKAEITACKLDLSLGGVKMAAETDPLIRQAVKLYCRSWYNFQGEADRYARAYGSLKDSLALCGDYNNADEPYALY